MVLKSLDLRFVYKAAAMILSIKSPDAMPLDRSATADRLSPCPNSLFAIARHPGRRSTSSQVALAGTQFHDRSAVDQTSWATAVVANADAKAVPVISRDHIMVLYIICFIRYLVS
jgi:hypothetical protein